LAVSETEVAVYPNEGAVSHDRVAVLYAGLDVKQNRPAVRYTGNRVLYPEGEASLVGGVATQAPG